MSSTFGHLVEDLETFVPGATLGDKLVNAKDMAAPAKHRAPVSYLKSAVLANIFSKVRISVEGIDPLKKAEARWHQAEMLCKQANKRIQHYRQFDHCSRPLPKKVDVHQIFHLARRKISDWLKDYEPDDLLEYTRHGPGGTGGDNGARLARPYTTPFFKFVTPMGVTAGAYWYYLRAIAQSDAWIRAIAQNANKQSSGAQGHEPNLSVMSYENRVQLADTVVLIARGSSLGFVPKNFGTHRAVCSEPGGNVYCQLGLGHIFRMALLKAGCDLNSQQRNQELAEAGSFDWKLETLFKACTMDMTMASDCLCVELPRELLEPKWFDVMDSLRCRETKYKGKWYRLEKFSSMGNGFTFELETMIFLALSQAVSDLTGTTEYYQDTFGPRYKYGELSVYGDDIIVPQRCAESTIQVLKYCGFRTNLEKTFVSGPFRESCGQDFFHGHPVRTAYFDSDLSQVKDLVKLLNVVQYNSELLVDSGCEPLTRTINYVRTLLDVIAPTIFRHLRSTDRTLGSSHIWCKSDEVHTSKLVIWDADVQAFAHPQIRTTLHEVDLKTECDLYQDYREFKYLQFLYANGRRPPSSEDGEDDWEGALASSPLRTSVKAGGSSGDVNVASLAGQGIVQLVHRCESVSRLAISLVGLVEDCSNPEPVYSTATRVWALKKLG